MGGLVGYLGYGCARWFEPRVPDRHRDDTSFPDSEWLLCEEFVTLDVRTQSLRVTAIARPAAFATAHDAVRDAEARVQILAEQIRRPTPEEVRSTCFRRLLPRAQRADARRAPGGIVLGRSTARSSASRRYIRAGDCMPSGPRAAASSTGPCSAAPCSCIARFDASIPSPYLFLLGLGDDARTRRRIVPRTAGACARWRRPSCVRSQGTRPRGIDEAQDLALERELLADEKERAEHVMLVDLGRNDIGRVAAKGTVRVESYMTIERYSHVMHMVSEVHGRLAPERDALDALASCFPAGTLSGAPKIRAMEIIDELEPMRRGPYGGGVGYLSYGGTMDTAIAIRTFHIDGDPVLPGPRAPGSLPTVTLCAEAGRDGAQSRRAGSGARGRRSVGDSMILMIDNYDSFTFNLVQLLYGLGAEVRVVRNDAIDAERHSCDSGASHLVISPGPCSPAARRV